MVSPGMNAAWGLALASLCFVAGCSRAYDGDRRYPLSGTVSVDGEPMEAGAISFIPGETDQRVSGGPITGGVYSVEEAFGANGGPYRVEIHWYRKTGRMLRNPDTGELYEERSEGLPDKYHKDSELTVDVSPDKTKFDFDLKSEPAE
jgi:hypothetical protein